MRVLKTLYPTFKLLEIYELCQKNHSEIESNEVLLEAYNKVFDESVQYLQYWKVLRLFDKVKEEIARRYYEERKFR